MSFLSVALPTILAFPATETFAATTAGVMRPLLGVGVLAGLALVFKPLLIGLSRAGLLVVKPRRSLEERNARRFTQGIRMLHRLARDVEESQPNLAAELRFMASRSK